MTRHLLAAGLSSDFWAAIKKGRLMIPEGAIRPFIEDALANEDGARLNHCAFQTGGIFLEIRVEKAYTRLTLPVVITLDTMTINRNEQRIEARVAYEKPMGDNFLGHLVAAVAQGLIFKMAAGRMTGSQVATVSAMERGQGRIEVDLSGLPPIRTLERKLPLIGLSVLEFVGVNGVRHIDNGIEVILAFGGRNV